MFKSFIAGITAISLTFASTTPLQAQNMNRDDVGKLIFGLAAIAVIGAAIDQNNDRDRRAAQSTPVRDEGRWGDMNRANRWSNLNRGQQQRGRNSRRALPRSCLQTVETRFGNQRFFGKRCLERNYQYVRTLPERCAVRLYTTNGPRRGFDPFCLREQGYRSDRRH